MRVKVFEAEYQQQRCRGNVPIMFYKIIEYVQVEAKSCNFPTLWAAGPVTCRWQPSPSFPCCISPDKDLAWKRPETIHAPSGEQMESHHHLSGPFSIARLKYWRVIPLTVLLCWDVTGRCGAAIIHFSVIFPYTASNQIWVPPFQETSVWIIPPDKFKNIPPVV